jgi:predicted nucleotidyltransferase
MDNQKIIGLKKIFKKFDSLKLAYLFGSQATKKQSELSDYDFAFYIDEKKVEAFQTSLAIAAQISLYLMTDNIDTVVINHIDSPELKYSIIKEGNLIYEVEPYKVIIEPKIMSEYFDFRFLLRKYSLTGHSMTSLAAIENGISNVKKYLNILQVYHKYSYEEVINETCNIFGMLCNVK